MSLNKPALLVTPICLYHTNCNWTKNIPHIQHPYQLHKKYNTIIYHYILPTTIYQLTYTIIIGQKNYTSTIIQLVLPCSCFLLLVNHFLSLIDPIPLPLPVVVPLPLLLVACDKVLTFFRAPLHAFVLQSINPHLLHFIYFFSRLNLIKSCFLILYWSSWWHILLCVCVGGGGVAQ